MKNTKIKLFTMFLAGILFSTFAVFAATISVPTNFTTNAVQYLQQLVLRDALGDTGIVLDGNTSKIMSNTICDKDGNNCRIISQLITGSALDGYLTGTSTFLTGEAGKWCTMSSNTSKISCVEDAPIGGGGTSLWDVNGGNIYYYTGNVGIGTGTPGYKLDVYGTGRFNNGIILSNTNNHQIKVTDTGPTPGGNGKDLSILGANGGGLVDNTFEGGKIELIGGNFVGNGGSVTINGGAQMGVFCIPPCDPYQSVGGSVVINGGAGEVTGNVILGNNGGKIGIGMTPLYKLDVNGTGRFSSIITNAINGIEFIGSAINNVYMYVGSNKAFNINRGKDITKGLSISNSNGDVGIGTDTPSSKLDVEGTGSFNDLLVSGKINTHNISAWKFQGDSESDYMNFGIMSGLPIRTWNLWINEHSIMYSMFNTNDNTNTFVIGERGINSSFGILKDDGYTALFVDGSNEYNVGIGNDSPYQKLDVNGAIKIGYPATNTGCNLNNEGTIAYHHIAGGSEIVICMLKNVPNSYGWVTIVSATGGVVSNPALNNSVEFGDLEGS